MTHDHHAIVLLVVAGGVASEAPGAAPPGIDLDPVDPRRRLRPTR